MTSLGVRCSQAERMDDPALDPDTYARVLGDLARVNRWTLAARPTLAFLGRAVGNERRFRLLDVGFGHGDMLRAIARWAEARGIEAELVGIDLNPMSARIAGAATPEDLPIEYRTGDYRDAPGPFDLVVSSLVAHHMSRAELRSFLLFMEGVARRGWMVNDLHRRRLPHLGYPVLARLLGVDPIVRKDGTLSIARSFRPAEWQEILSDAGIPAAARIARRFPYRLCVERLR